MIKRVKELEGFAGLYKGEARLAFGRSLLSLGSVLFRPSSLRVASIFPSGSGAQEELDAGQLLSVENFPRDEFEHPS